MYVGLKLLTTGAMRDNVRREKNNLRLTLNREQGSDAYTGSL